MYEPLTEKEKLQEKSFDHKAGKNKIYPSNLGFTVFLKEDRHMWIMRKTNFYNWMMKAGLRNIVVKNMIYTPPVPKTMAPLYDIIDTVCSKLPLIKRCSLMLFGSAIK